MYGMKRETMGMAGFANKLRTGRVSIRDELGIRVPVHCQPVMYPAMHSYKKNPTTVMTLTATNMLPATTLVDMARHFATLATDDRHPLNK